MFMRDAFQGALEVHEENSRLKAELVARTRILAALIFQISVGDSEDHVVITDEFWDKGHDNSLTFTYGLCARKDGRGVSIHTVR